MDDNTRTSAAEEEGEDRVSSNAPSVVFTEPNTYKRAWFALLLVVLLRIAVSVFQFSYSVVPGITAEYLNVSLTAVNWFATVTGLTYVIVSIYTGWIFENLGVRRSLWLAGFLCTLGALIRFIASLLHSYALSMVGQIVGSTSAPLSLNIMTKFSATWFTEDKRATAGMFVACNYGAILVMFMIPAITKTSDQIPKMLLIVFGIALASFVALLIIPKRPPTPPSIVAATPGEKPSFSNGIKALLQSKDFWILFLIHGLNVGLSIALGNIFTQVIAPYGYTDVDAGQLNALGFVAGTIGCMVAGPVLDKTKQHILFLRLIAPGVLVSDVAYLFLVRTDHYESIMFVVMMNQFFLSFLVPTVIELGAEALYPIPDSTTTSILWLGAQIFGSLFIPAMDAARDENGVPKNNMFRALVMQAVFAGLIVILAFLFRGKMARSETIMARQQEFGMMARQQVFQAQVDSDTTLHDSLQNPPVTESNEKGSNNNNEDNQA